MRKIKTVAVPPTLFFSGSPRKSEDTVFFVFAGLMLYLEPC